MAARIVGIPFRATLTAFVRVVSDHNDVAEEALDGLAWLSERINAREEVEA